jgi:NADH-quinone oxidoreductase subunit L
MEYSLLIIVTPFALFLLLGLLGTKLKPAVAGMIGTLGMSVCTILAYAVAYQD